MNLYSDCETLEESLNYLKNASNQSERNSAASEIKQHLESAAKELSIERFSLFENSLFQTLFLLFSSDHTEQRKSGVYAVQIMTESTSSASEKKIIKFADALSLALVNSTDFLLIQMLAEAIGHVAKYSVVSHVEYVERELDRSLEWLEGNVSHRRLAACAVLQQLAENTPSIFFAKSKEFFSLIWLPLRDTKNEVRFSAAKALSACLAVLKERSFHLQSYCNIYDQICIGLKRKSKEEVHGSLLVTFEMLLHTGDFMLPRFREVMF